MIFGGFANLKLSDSLAPEFLIREGGCLIILPDGRPSACA
jgi:hypothetical protein